MEPGFRIAAEADVDVLLALMKDYYVFDGHGWDHDRARDALVVLLRNSQFGLVWLVVDEQTPVGYVVVTFGYSLEFLGRDAFIDELFLIPSHRNRGWGKNILAFVEDQARAHEVRAIHLEVVRGNNHARGLYAAHGYVDHDHSLMSKWIEHRFAKPSRSPS